MKWIKQLLGLSTPLDKKKRELSNTQVKAVMAQRYGNLKRYAALSKKAEDIEDEIIELLNQDSNKN